MRSSTTTAGISERAIPSAARRPQLCGGEAVTEVDDEVTVDAVDGSEAGSAVQAATSSIVAVAWRRTLDDDGGYRLAWWEICTLFSAGR
jgi:hypothetical protein